MMIHYFIVNAEVEMKMSEFWFRYSEIADSPARISYVRWDVVSYADSSSTTAIDNSEQT